MNVTEAVRKALFEFAVEENASITVALSGGADSVVLLHTLIVLMGELRLNVRAAHLNHSLRGESSDHDERFVKELCGKWNVPLETQKADVQEISNKTGEGIEQSARRLRYEFLEKVSGGYIATAHNLNDNAETLLLNMVRGCGTNGLCGIPPKRGVIIRPLLEVSRREIEEYAKENGLHYVTDETNFLEKYSRNRIRRNVLPELERINSEYLNAFKRLISLSKLDHDYLTEKAEELLEDSACNMGYNTIKLKEVHKAVRLRAIALILKTFKRQDIHQSHILSIDGLLSTGGQVNISGDLFARVRNNVLTVFRQQEPIKEWQLPFLAGTFAYPGGRIEIQKISIEEFSKLKSVNKLSKIIALDYDKISANTVIRSRKEGDYFRQSGRNAGKSLKKLFIEARLTPDKKQKSAVIAFGHQVIAVEGFGVNEGFHVDGTTKNVAVVKFFSP